jgi:regulatory subunit for Cdc7p protein kinase
MAQVSVQAPAAAMSRNRAPLSNLPNAINNPPTMTTTAVKRSRSNQRDTTYGQPPSKKQAVDVSSTLRTPRRSKVDPVVPAKAAVPAKKPVLRARPATAGNPPAFAVEQQVRKAHAAYTVEHVEPARKAAPVIQRTTQAAAVVQRTHQETAAEQTTDDVRAWQKHYRKAFPGYIFFFENVPADVLSKAQKQIITLGAVRC